MDRIPEGTDGTYHGVRYFTCEDGHGLFIEVGQIAKDNRFDDDDSQQPDNDVQLPASSSSPPTTHSARSQSCSEPRAATCSASEGSGRSKSLGSASQAASSLDSFPGILKTLQEVIGSASPGELSES